MACALEYACIKISSTFHFFPVTVALTNSIIFRNRIILEHLIKIFFSSPLYYDRFSTSRPIKIHTSNKINTDIPAKFVRQNNATATADALERRSNQRNNNRQLTTKTSLLNNLHIKETSEKYAKLIYL